MLLPFILAFIAFLLIRLLYQQLKRPLNYWRQKGVKQGRPLLFFGDSYNLAIRKFSKADMMYYVYNMFPGSRYSGYYQFCNPTLLIRDPELIKQMTIMDFDHFTDHRPLFYEDPKSPWSHSLIALKGKRWRDMRTTLSPSFTSSKMKFLFGLINKTAENFVDHFKQFNQEEMEIELKTIFLKFANDVITSSAFGVEVDSMKNPENEFYALSTEVTSFSTITKAFKFFGYMFFPNFFKVFKISFFSQSVKDFFLNFISDAIRIREEKNIVRPDMLHLLIQAKKGDQKADDPQDRNENLNFAAGEQDKSNYLNGKNSRMCITDFEITAQAMLFYFAGFDSVSGLMAFACYELGANPDIQNRLRAEIKETLKACNGALTYEALFQMKYLDMIISETLRKWPGAVGIDRVCVKPYTIKAKAADEVDVHLPVDSTIAISIFGLHRDPKYYPNPEKFDPERFSDENKSKINPYTYLPFGVGPRTCIGSRFALMKTKIIIFHLINDFEIVPCSKSVIPAKISAKSFTLMAEDGFWFKLCQIC